MLGSVARKLRIFGFDTLYVAHTADDQVLRMGVEQNRIILTADKEFFKRIVKQGARGVLVGGASDLDDLAHIFAKVGITSVGVDLGSRCAACNGLLEPRTPADVAKVVPANVAARHREFYQCAGCGKIYWDGSHMRRARAFAGTLERRLRSGSTASKG
jgi:hypothetical protein